ncbi:MAG: GldG family protein [Pseudomonadales bacterium]|nr:GldG family protein [Pseudomonadales bacterium]
MNKKFLFSPAGLVGIAVALVLSVAIISLLPSLRIDLTEDQLYTLSDGSRNIVANLETPLELMFFYSESATEDQPQIRAYGTRVQELLREIVIASEGNLTLTVIDPEPFSEDEDLATQYGIQAVPVSAGGEEIYFGLVVAPNLAPEEVNPLIPMATETMPLVRPDQEQFLEYEFMKLIINVANPQRTVVGLITDLEIDGGFNPATGQATPSWFVMDLIRQLYEVRRIPTTADTIEEDIDILMVVHPQGLSEQLLYAIDQHVMRAGETLVFLDPNADSMVSLSPQGALIPAGMSSNLPGLLDAWGVDYADDLVLTDNELALRVRMSQTERPIPHLGMLGVQRQYLAQEDIITSRLETINLSSTGVISQAEAATTAFEPLILSSSDSMLMDRALLESVTDPSVLFDEFEAGNETHVIAARVTGVVNSAFPDGRPVVEEEVEEEAAADEATESEAELEAESEDTANPENPATPVAETSDDIADDVAEEPVAEHLASSNGTVNIVVFADSDLLMDRLWVQVAQFLGQRIPQPFANNGDILINTLDNLSGGADLVSIRSRGTYSRPFTRVIDLQRQADDRLRTEEAELLDRLAETEASLAQLNQDEEGNPIGQITPEIQAEIDRFNGELLDTRRRLRDVQFQLTEDIDRLGSNLKAINTALIPILLTILALIAHFARVRRRNAAA